MYLVKLRHRKEVTGLGTQPVVRCANVSPCLSTTGTSCLKSMSRLLSMYVYAARDVFPRCCMFVLAPWDKIDSNVLIMLDKIHTRTKKSTTVCGVLDQWRKIPTSIWKAFACEFKLCTKLANRMCEKSLLENAHGWLISVDRGNPFRCRGNHTRRVKNRGFRDCGGVSPSGVSTFECVSGPRSGMRYA